jgi:hypothetical protein
MISRQVEEFLESRRHTYLNPEAYRQARRALLQCDAAAVQDELLSRYQSRNIEERARVIEGLALLYKTEATELILRGLQDKSDLVRWVASGCLHDFGDARAQPDLLVCLQQDSHPHVRGVAASALGRLGSPDVLPALHAVWQADHQADSQGHTPSSQSESAITELLWRWVVRQISGTSSPVFEERFSQGRLQGRITAEGIPFDDQGRILHTPRYAHLPLSVLGNGCSTKLDLRTNLVAPFEVAVEYSHPACVIQRMFVFCRIPDADDVNWSIHTILDPSAMNQGEHEGDAT